MDELFVESVDAVRSDARTADLSPTPPSVEEVCATVQNLSERALESTLDLSASAKKLLTIAKEGRIRDFRTVSGSMAALARRFSEQAAEIASAAAIDPQVALSSSWFVQELLSAARAEGLTLHAEGPLLYCFPHVVRILPAEGAVTVGRKREYRIRPKALVRLLRGEQQKPVRFKPAQFLQLLYSAYLLAVPSEARGEPSGFVVPLSRIYEILTLFPGTAKEYGLPDFSRDVYLLDKSGTSMTKDGATVTFPASTGTRTSHSELRVVTDTGAETRYYGINFQKSLSAS